MADIAAFRAFRYDLGRAGLLSDLICPPYDVIGPELQEKLYAKSPYNAVRLEFNREEPGDSDSANRYTRAAGFLRDWIREGILRQDSSRSLYVYHQQCEVHGRIMLRRGFFARVRLEPFGTGNIFPHEETMSGPKADRLSLYRTTRMNISPVFGLYPDENHEVQKILDEAIGRALPLEAMDHLGVVHRLWPLDDQGAVSAVTGLMGPKPIFIADGHHRYETSLRYQAEARERGEIKDDQAAANYVLMALVGMDDPGLSILPTHRLVLGLPGLNADLLRQRLAPTFDVECVGVGTDGAQKAWFIVDGSQDALGLGLAADDSWWWARYRGGWEIMEELAPGHSPRWRDLAVSLLHLHVLGNCLPPEPTHDLRYVHELDEVINAVGAKTCDLGVLVPAATMADVAAIAGNREKMPPKSTYFYPKLQSGLVFNPLT
jgi:uncharacterized protein (DUF1015 family)